MTIFDFFKDFRHFRYPDYQRDFVWNQDQVKDFIFSFGNSKNFIGSIILCPKEIENDELPYKKGVDIVDGQQRTTILSLLFYHLLKIDKNILVKTIDKELQNREVEDDDRQDAYEDFCDNIEKHWAKRDKEIERVDSKSKKKSKKDKILEASDFIKNTIETEQALEKIVENMLFSVFNVLILLEPKNQIRRYKSVDLFRDLNTIGVPLEWFDIIKANYVGTNKELKENWKSFSAVVKRIYGKKYPDFFKHFYLGNMTEQSPEEEWRHKRYIGNDEISSQINKEIETSKNDVFNNMNHYAIFLDSLKNEPKVFIEKAQKT